MMTSTIINPEQITQHKMKIVLSKVMQDSIGFLILDSTGVDSGNRFQKMDSGFTLLQDSGFQCPGFQITLNGANKN